jgi:hypothetical protein
LSVGTRDRCVCLEFTAVSFNFQFSLERDIFFLAIYIAYITFLWFSFNLIFVYGKINWSVIVCIYSQTCTCRIGHLLITVTFVLSLSILLYILIRYSGHLFNVVSGHHILAISSVKHVYNGKFVFKITPEVISKVRYFSHIYKKSRGVIYNYKIYCLI